ncbi:class I adenylate-forming enzyme family protein [Jatrophihabitans sp. DSM 45814]
MNRTLASTLCYEDPEVVAGGDRPSDFRSYVERILDRCSSTPDAIMLSDPDRDISAKQFGALVLRLAQTLAARGLDRGDRIAILADISAEALALRYAAHLIGCATVYCPNTGSVSRLSGFIAKIAPSVLVVFPRTATAACLAAAENLVPVVYSIGPVSGADVDLLALSTTPSQAAVPARVGPQDLAVLIASGGTTGESKASRRSFGAYARAVAGPPAADHKLLICTPFAYIAQVLTDQTLLGGGRVILRDGFDPAAVLQTIEAERITHLCLVEPLLVELIDHPDLLVRDHSSLVALSHIGATAPASLRRRLLERIGPVLVHPYGASEAGLISVLASPEYDLSRPGHLATTGRVLPGVDLRVVGPDGTYAKPGVEGAIVVRTPGLADGYWGRRSQPAFSNGWYCTGDLGRLDAQGYLQVRGRLADARHLNGRTVMPVDIEDAVCSHPDVRYAVALPLDLHGADAFAMMVVCAPGTQVSVDDLRGYIARQSPDLVPATLLIVDKIPITEQGKPDRSSIGTVLKNAARDAGAMLVGRGSGWRARSRDRRGPSAPRPARLLSGHRSSVLAVGVIQEAQCVSLCS